MSPLLEVRNLSRGFRQRHGLFSRSGPRLTALDGVSFTIAEGEIFGLVGESGSGKSTLARCVLQLLEAHGGEVIFRGRDLCSLGARQLRQVRRELQVVFQDSGGALSPRRTVFQSLSEPLEVFAPASRSDYRLQCAAALERVGLDREFLPRLPRQLSSGQKQRVALARALMTSPRLIIADEAVSSLDVSVQAQMLELMASLRDRYGIAFLLISHDLAVISQIANRVAVMYRGRIVESGPVEAVFNSAAHPYTQALLEAVPDPDPQVPFAARLPPEILRRHGQTGCRFAPRCAKAMTECSRLAPDAVALDDDRRHHVECLLYGPHRKPIT